MRVFPSIFFKNIEISMLTVWFILQGKIEVQGTPADLSKSGVDFAKLVGTVETDDQNDGTETIDRKMSRKSSIRSSAASRKSNADGSFDGDANNEQKDEGVQMEASSKGKIKGSIPGNYFAAGANWFVLLLLAISFVLVQLMASAADVWVSIW